MRAIWNKQRLVFLIAAILLFQAASGLPIGQTNAVSYVPTGEKGRKTPATNSNEGLTLIPHPPVQDQLLTSDGVNESKAQAEGSSQRMARSRRNVEEKIKKIVFEQLGVHSQYITMDANLVNNLGADSLDLVELIMAIEEAFDCKISDEDAQKIHTIQDLVNRVKICAR